jgi:hypothetical protein
MYVAGGTSRAGTFDACGLKISHAAEDKFPILEIVSDLRTAGDTPVFDCAIGTIGIGRCYTEDEHAFNRTRGSKAAACVIQRGFGFRRIAPTVAEVGPDKGPGPIGAGWRRSCCKLRIFRWRRSGQQYCGQRCGKKKTEISDAQGRYSLFASGLTRLDYLFILGKTALA